MSTLQVRVTTIEDMKEHPNADALEIAIVGGWQCCVPKGQYQIGDKAIYFPPDTVLPDEWIESFGIAAYTSKGRIRQARLRGEPSFGLVVKPADESWEVGTDVADYYGATKYDPPVKFSAADAEEDHPLFLKYTEVENLRNFTEVFETGEQVVISEKLDGTNVRVGIIEGQRMAGSRQLRRKEPEEGAEAYGNNTYWFPWTLQNVVRLLEEYAKQHAQVILYGEVYGRGIQKLQYGQKGKAFAAFDMLVDGNFLDYPQFLDLMTQYDIPTVPVQEPQPYSLDMVKEQSVGNTDVGGGHIKEGVVIRPIQERTNPRIGRVIMKYVSDDYLLKKKDKDDVTDQ